MLYVCGALFLDLSLWEFGGAICKIEKAVASTKSPKGSQTARKHEDEDVPHVPPHKLYFQQDLHQLCFPAVFEWCFDR